MTAGPGALEEQAVEFAGQMTELLSTTVSPDVDIRPCQVTLSNGSLLFIVGNQVPAEPPSESAVKNLSGDPIPVPEIEGLSVVASWKFGPNSTGEWIKVQWSRFGLYTTSSKGKLSPFLRMEVDPDKEGWARAHVNVTAESMQLGHIYGRRGLPYKRVHQIHIPVGGYAYRPCLEDFLEFAIDEGLLPERDGWRDAVNKYRQDYHDKQLMSLVGKRPEVAIAALQRNGHLPRAEPSSK